MKLTELKCPNCGGSLELKGNGFARCIFCGQIVALEDEPNTSTKIKTVRDYEVKTNNSKSNNKVNANTINTNSIKKNNKSSFLWVLIVIGSIMLILAGTLTKTAKNNKTIETDFDGLTNTSGECNQLFLSDIFEKDYKSITQEDKNSIKYLSVGFQEDHFIYKYSFQDYSEYSNEEEFLKTTNVWTIETTNLPWSSDFTDFEGLTRFDYDLAISQVRFSKDCKLKYVTCSDNIKDLQKSIPVSQIEVLVIDAYGESLDGIEEFENLISLTVDSRDITDISKLANCLNLKNLNLNSYQLTDFGILSKMKQLEELTLSCDELRTLDFVEGMQDLKSLSILGGSLYDAASLKGLRNLKTLILDADFESENFEVIGTLTNLESLDISENIDNMEYLKELKNMKKLKISNLEDFSLLTPMKNLEKLTLYYCQYDNAYLLSQNKKLRSLTINYEFGIDILDLGFLSDVKTLQEIKIYGDEFIPRECQNLETVLKIPSLETVRVYGAEIAMDPEKIKTNESLKTLDLRTVSIVSMDTTGEEEELELSNTLEFVKNFPNLEVVTVKSSKLNSIEWVKHLKKLRDLDVTDNYISNFSVLNELSKLERLVCSQNANTNVKLDNSEVENICTEDD